MTEYTMSKAAGEVLCADINKQMKNVRVVVRRLPRLPTDQTASLIQTGSADPTTVMLPIIREVQGKRRAGDEAAQDRDQEEKLREV